MPSASYSVRVALLDRFAPNIETTRAATLPEGFDLFKVGTGELPLVMWSSPPSNRPPLKPEAL